MQKKRTILVVVAVLAVVAYGVYAGRSEDKASETTSQIDEFVIPEWIVSASGTVVPTRQAKLGFPLLGRVKRVAVQVGDTVRAGQVLAELDSADLQADVDAFQAALDLARADLASLDAGSRPEEIEGAEAAYRGALARYRQVEAGATRAELEAADAAVQAARERLAQSEAGAKAQEAAALARLDSARAALERLEAGPTAEEIKSAELAREQARNSLWAAQLERDGLKGTFGKDSYQGQAGDARVAAAETAVNIAATGLLKLKQGPTAEERRIAAAAVAQAEADLAAIRDTRDAAIVSAQSALASASARQTQIKEGATTQELDIAASAVEGARAALLLRQTGPTTPALEAAQARVRQAEGLLRRAKAELERSFLVATFDAAVGAVAIAEGETPAPGSTAIIVGDIGKLRIETTDLRETSVTRVRVGQPVQITLDGLPDQKLEGKVARIAPMATPGAGGVNYTVTIDLDNLHPDLRWGMTANVEIDTR